MTTADQHYVRGSEVQWRTKFFDRDRNPTAPPSVTLYVHYKKRGKPETDVIQMVGLEDYAFYAEWDSSKADAGYVYWHIRSTGGETPQADEGRFTLLANPANPDIEEL